MIEALNARMRAHQQKYRCHICRKPSEGPGLSDTQGAKGDTLVTKDWDKPTGLTRCDRCHQWTCEEHLTVAAPGLLGRLARRKEGHKLCLQCAPGPRSPAA